MCIPGPKQITLLYLMQWEGSGDEIVCKDHDSMDTDLSLETKHTMYTDDIHTQWKTKQRKGMSFGAYLKCLPCMLSYHEVQ